MSTHEKYDGVDRRRGDREQRIKSRDRRTDRRDSAGDRRLADRRRNPAG